MTAAAQRLAEAALAIPAIESVAVFLTGSADGGGEALELGGAAGISGPPLDGLVAAVGDPQHPIRRSAGDPDATFDVRPMNPGGPALRSHLPIRTGAGVTIGVLAVAHDRPLADDERVALRAIASEAAAALGDRR